MYAQLEGFVSRYCIPEKDGYCKNCGTHFADIERNLQIECPKYLDNRMRRGVAFSGGVHSPETPIHKLAKALTPCSCPEGTLENKKAARSILYRWPTPEQLKDPRWAVGVATAPRKDHDLDVCLQSIRVNGWYPQVFAEPGCNLSKVGECTLYVHGKKKGAWRNWVFMAETLLAQNTPYILMMQDDTWLLPGIKHYLDNMKWPNDAAFISLYLSKAQTKFNKPGFVEVTQEKKHGKPWSRATIYWGACAWAFPRKVLEELLKQDMVKNWNGVSPTPDRKPDQVKHIDNVVPRVTRNVMKKKWYSLYPSVGQHTASHSTIMHSPKGKPLGNVGNRAASEIMSDWSWVGSTGKNNFSNDPVYNAALREWSTLFGRPLYPIAPGLYNDLKTLVKKDMDVLELGSGVSSWLLRGLGANLTSLEQDPVIAAVSKATYVPITEKGWYGWQPQRGTVYGMVVVDGPAHRNREGIVEHIREITRPGSLVIVDDTQRDAENKLADTLASTLRSTRVDRNDGNRKWSILLVG